MSGSGSNQLDLFIQDFLTTNRILNAHVPWPTLVSRRFVEAGAQRKVFSFQSAGATHFAVGTLLELPDGDCFRIELVAPADAMVAEEHRLDCLRMTYTATHTAHEVSRLPAAIIIRVATRNRGLIPVVFVVREGGALTEPILV